jgi:hypothetical protein
MDAIYDKLGEAAGEKEAEQVKVKPIQIPQSSALNHASRRGKSGSREYEVKRIRIPWPLNPEPGGD